jgi:hypothetical protein
MRFNISELEMREKSRLEEEKKELDEYMVGSAGGSGNPSSGYELKRIEHGRSGITADISGELSTQERRAVKNYTDRIMEKSGSLFPDRTDLERKVFRALKSIPMPSYSKVYDYVVNEEL